MEHKLGRKEVKKLNRDPRLQAFNATFASETAAGEAFGQVMDLANEHGVNIGCVIGGPVKLETGTEHFVHPLTKAGTEDEPVTDSVFVRQLYFREGGSIEVTAYFS